MLNTTSGQNTGENIMSLLLKAIKALDHQQIAPISAMESSSPPLAADTQTPVFHSSHPHSHISFHICGSLQTLHSTFPPCSISDSFSGEQLVVLFLICIKNLYKKTYLQSQKPTMSEALSFSEHVSSYKYFKKLQASPSLYMFVEVPSNSLVYHGNRIIN